MNFERKKERISKGVKYRNKESVMEKYTLKNQIEKVLRKENTSFLNPFEVNYVVNGLKKHNIKYQIFSLFEGSEKIIVYQDKLDITLFQIKTNALLTHKEILGALFSHNLNEDTFGDIIIDKNNYYIVIQNKIKKAFLYNFNKIGKKQIKLVERPLKTVKNYQQKFEEIKLQVSSLRIDNIIAKLIPTSRAISSEIISLKKVVVNYQILKNRNYSIKGNDILSIRGVGKFKFIKTSIKTKNDKYSITIYKYT